MMRSDRFDIDSLASMNLDALRRTWAQTLAEAPPPLRAPDLLRRELAWRLEAQVYGDIDGKLRRELDRLGKATRACAQNRTSTTATPVGSTLVREWDGVAYSVVVLKSGYLFEGETFGSLSEIARRITGVRWSGPRFFGLKARGS